MDNKVKIVKVKAYPIAAIITIGTTATPGQVLKLTTTGFLIDTHLPTATTGEKFHVAFELPLTHHSIGESCVIVKIYKSQGSTVLEGHFLSPAPANEQHIMRWLAAAKKATP